VAQADRDKALSRRMRIVALVIAGTMLAWLAVQAIGPRLGLGGAWALVFDIAALAAFAWALATAFQIRRARRES